MVSITVFLATASLLSGLGSSIDQKNRRLDEIRGMGDRQPVKEKKSFSVKKLKSGALDLLKKSEEKAAKDGKRKESKNKAEEKLLALAEFPLGANQFMLLRLLCGVLVFGAAFVLSDDLGLEADLVPLVGVAGLVLGILIPQKLLESAAKKKQSLYRDALPDVMDLLIVSVEAGLGFDSALLRLYEKDKSPLMQELMRAVTDVQHGMSKKESYAAMSERCQVKEITSFLNALVQAEQMGISIKSVLKSQADSLREDRRQRAEEKALKAPVTMLIPLVIFIFPVIFIVLLGPALMNIKDVFL